MVRKCGCMVCEGSVVCEGWVCDSVGCEGCKGVGAVISPDHQLYLLYWSVTLDEELARSL